MRIHRQTQAVVLHALAAACIAAVVVPSHAQPTCRDTTFLTSNNIPYGNAVSGPIRWAGMSSDGGTATLIVDSPYPGSLTIVMSSNWTAGTVVNWQIHDALSYFYHTFSFRSSGLITCRQPPAANSFTLAAAATTFNITVSYESLGLAPCSTKFLYPVISAVSPAGDTAFLAWTWVPANDRGNKVCDSSPTSWGVGQISVAHCPCPAPPPALPPPSPPPAPPPPAPPPPAAPRDCRQASYLTVGNAPYEGSMSGPIRSSVSGKEVGTGTLLVDSPGPGSLTLVMNSNWTAGTAVAWRIHDTHSFLANTVSFGPRGVSCREPPADNSFTLAADSSAFNVTVSYESLGLQPCTRTDLYAVVHAASPDGEHGWLAWEWVAAKDPGSKICGSSPTPWGVGVFALEYCPCAQPPAPPGLSPVLPRLPASPTIPEFASFPLPPSSPPSPPPLDVPAIPLPPPPLRPPSPVPPSLPLPPPKPSPPLPLGAPSLPLSPSATPPTPYADLASMPTSPWSIPSPPLPQHDSLPPLPLVIPPPPSPDIPAAFLPLQKSPPPLSTGIPMSSLRPPTSALPPSPVHASAHVPPPTPPPPSPEPPSVPLPPTTLPSRPSADLPSLPLLPPTSPPPPLLPPAPPPPSHPSPPPLAPVAADMDGFPFAACARRQPFLSPLRLSGPAGPHNVTAGSAAEPATATYCFTVTAAAQVAEDSACADMDLARIVFLIKPSCVAEGPKAARRVTANGLPVAPSFATATQLGVKYGLLSLPRLGLPLAALQQGGGLRLCIALDRASRCGSPAGLCAGNGCTYSLINKAASCCPTSSVALP